MRYASLALSCLLLCVLSCARQGKNAARPDVAGRAESELAERSPPLADPPDQMKADERVDGREVARKGVLAGGKEEAEPREEAPRKIIYTANVNLIVENFDAAVEELDALIRNNKAFIASSDVRGERGKPRSGMWTVRVPQGQFDTLVAAVAKLGEALQNRRDSQDVTEGYYDAKERLKTLEVEEEALRKYYAQKQPTSTPAEMMAVHDKLTEFRTQIEQTKGRIKRWDNQVELATVAINVRERKDYVPPSSSNAPVEPSFGQSLGGTFSGSIDALVVVGKDLVLGVVAVAPWLAIIAVVGSPLWVHLWRARRTRKRLSGPVVAPAPPNS
jgi:hypothetical protein